MSFPANAQRELLTKYEKITLSNIHEFVDKLYQFKNIYSATTVFEFANGLVINPGNFINAIEIMIKKGGGG